MHWCTDGVCDALGRFVPIYTLSSLGCSAGFSPRSRIPNKNLLSSNKCLLLKELLSSLFFPRVLLTCSLFVPLLCAGWHCRHVSIQAGPPGPPRASLLSLTHQPNSPLTSLSAFPVLFFSHSPSVITRYSRELDLRTQVCPRGLKVYCLSALLSFSVPFWTPERTLLIEASTSAFSRSSATTDNWTRHSHITLFSFSSTLLPPLPLRCHSVVLSGPVPVVITFGYTVK